MRSYHLLMLNKTLPGQPKESTVCAPPRVEFYKKKKKGKKCKNDTETHTHKHTPGWKGKTSPIVLTATTHEQ